MLKNNLLLCIVISIISSFSSSGQDLSYYTVDGYQDSYVELTDFKTTYKQSDDWVYFSKNFDLDFEFPFYDSVFTKILCTSQSFCKLGNSPNFNLWLFFFGYEMDEPGNPDSLTSDFRYANIDLDTQRAFVIQYTNVRLYTDTTVEMYNSYLNFQTWLYENGDIEIRFGKSNLDNSPNYIPGSGFYQFDEGFDPFLAGPKVFIQHATDDDRILGVEGPYDSFNVVDDVGYLRTMPPEGWVLRFNRKMYNSTKNVNVNRINIHPNPVKDILYVDVKQGNVNVSTSQLSIFDFQGKQVHTQRITPIDETPLLDVSQLTPGLYLLHHSYNGNTFHRKFFKW